MLLNIRALAHSNMTEIDMTEIDTAKTTGLRFAPRRRNLDLNLTGMSTSMGVGRTLDSDVPESESVAHEEISGSRTMDEGQRYSVRWNNV